MTATTIPSMLVEDVELCTRPIHLPSHRDPIDCGHLWEPHLWKLGRAHCPFCGSTARWTNDPRSPKEDVL